MHGAAENAKETGGRPHRYSGALLVAACLVLGIFFAMQGYGCARDALRPSQGHGWMLSNARNIYVALLQHSMSAPLNEANSDSPGWPSYGAPVERYAFTNSTDLFVYMVTSGVLKIGFEFFSAPGMPRARPYDSETFGPENNTWCVVADVGPMPDHVPVVFTSNVRAQTLADLTGPVRNTLSDEPPFGRHVAYVVTKGGRGYILDGRNPGTWEDLVGDLSGFTNRVLRP